MNELLRTHYWDTGGKNNDCTNINNIGKVTSNEELLLIALETKELYGKQICQAIFDASGGAKKLKVGSLYPTLHSLEKKGLVVSRWGDERRSERGGARRRYYRLSDNGISTLEALGQFYRNLSGWQPTTVMA